MRLLNLRPQIRSLMLAVLFVAVGTWVGVLGWRRVQFLEQSRRCRQQAAYYAQHESQNVDAFAQIANIAHDVASAEPPAAGSHDGAWRAYRKYVSDLHAKVGIAKARLDDYERRRAVRRYLERLAAKYERAAMRPWLGAE